MQSLGGVTPYQLNSVKIGVVLARGLSKNSVTKNNHATVTFHPFSLYAPTGAIISNFGMWGDIADIIIRAKFYVDRSGSFLFFTGLTGRPYNSVSSEHYRATL